MNRFQVVSFNNRHFIIECTTTTECKVAIQRVDHRKGGYTDLAEVQADCRIMNAHGDKPHPEMCTCDWCAWDRFCLTGERD